MRLYIPTKLNEQNVFSFLKVMKENANLESIIFDYSRVTFSAPFGTLILSEELRSLRKHRERNGLSTGFQIKQHLFCKFMLRSH